MNRLIAMDLDKTLVMPDGTVPKETVDGLRALRSRGMRIALCTGRVGPSAEHYAEMVGGASVVSFNGSYIRTEDGRTYTSEIPLDLVKDVIGFCHDVGLYVQLYRGNTILVEKFTPELKTDLDINFTDYEELGDLTKAELCASPKLVALELSDRVDGFMETLRERFPELSMSQSSRYVIEIMPAGIDKAYGLAKVAEALGIPQNETVAIGDGMNDLPMIEWAGTGVAVANADPRLKAAADMVTEKEMSYGVLEAADRLFS